MVELGAHLGQRDVLGCGFDDFHLPLTLKFLWSARLSVEELCVSSPTSDYQTSPITNTARGNANLTLTLTFI